MTEIGAERAAGMVAVAEVETKAVSACRVAKFLVRRFKNFPFL